jgi:hypothetical protein
VNTGSDSRTQPNLREPGIKSFDISLSRSQRIKERVSLQFRAEFYNAFNTTQFGGPIDNVNDLNFGKILSSAGGRNIQFGLGLSY